MYRMGSREREELKRVNEKFNKVCGRGPAAWAVRKNLGALRESQLALLKAL